MTAYPDQRQTGLRSAHFADGDMVLRGRLLGEERLVPSRLHPGNGAPVFGDDVWHLTGGESRRNVPAFHPGRRLRQDRRRRPADHGQGVPLRPAQRAHRRDQAPATPPDRPSGVQLRRRLLLLPRPGAGRDAASGGDPGGPRRLQALCRRGSQRPRRSHQRRLGRQLPRRPDQARPLRIVPHPRPSGHRSVAGPDALRRGRRGGSGGELHTSRPRGGARALPPLGPVLRPGRLHRHPGCLRGAGPAGRGHRAW